jgi:2,4-diketo-3-deoxy-L-fuconate hydrolase
VRQVTAAGFNYKKHIEEFKMNAPPEPELFLKAITSPDDPISRGPNAGTKLDWEVELAIVVGRAARDITAAEASKHVFGYLCLNDISDRATQVDSEGGQHLVRAKSRPGYTPIGPYLTTGVDGMNLAGMRHRQSRGPAARDPELMTLVDLMSACEAKSAAEWERRPTQP